MKKINISPNPPKDWKNPRGKNSNEFYLFCDNWNDYGYETYFDVAFGDEPLGGIKIYTPKLDESANSDRCTSSYIKKELVENVGNDFYSLGMSIEYYKKLIKALNNLDEVPDVLAQFNDFSTLEPAKIAELEVQKGVEWSLLRGDDAKRVFDIIKLTSEYEFGKKLKPGSEFLKFVSEDNVGAILKIIDYLGKTKQNQIVKILKADQNLTDDLFEWLIDNAGKLTDYNHDYLIEVMTAVLGDKANQVAALVGLFEKDPVSELITKIREQLIVSEWDKDTELGHYCPLKTIGLLINQEEKGSFLRLTNSRQMNDPMEGRELLDKLELLDIDDQDYSQSFVYVSSATTALNSLPMWKQYADNAQGAVLVYDDSFVQRFMGEKQFQVGRVCYLSKNHISGQITVKVSGISDSGKIKSIENDLNQLLNLISQKNDSQKKQIRKALNRINYLFKAMSYSYEEEYGFRSRFETTSLDKKLVNAKCPLGHFAGHSVADALLHNPSTAECVVSNSTGLFIPSRP